MDVAVERALAEARALGFLGPGPLEQHHRSAAAFLEALGDDLDVDRALDLGSGGGVPGLLLAVAIPGVAWVLLDHNRRRTSFLARAVASLGLGGRVRVVRAAAEDAGHDAEHRERYDLVVSRSFGPPASTAECGSALLRLGGRLLVAEPPESPDDRWPSAGLSTLALHQDLAGPVAVFRRTGPLDDHLPRSWRTMERRPRW